jgi:serine/threonine-protein kinase
LEPYVRRRWPATLVSWSRLLAGGFRDPLVGRDVLVGCLFGAFVAAVGNLGWFVPSWLGHPPARPLSGPEWHFLGARTIIAGISYGFIIALLTQLSMLFVLFFLRVLLRKQWAAAIAFVLLTTVFFSSWSQFDPVSLGLNVIINGLTVFLLIRFGLLALVATWVFALLTNFPLTTQASAWYAGISLAGILLMAAIAFYAFYTSLGGRPVFGGAVLEE